MIVQDARTLERFEVYAQRSGLAQLRSLDNPGAPARTETNAGLAKDYDVVPAARPAGADDDPDLLREDRPGVWRRLYEVAR